MCWPIFARPAPAGSRASTRRCARRRGSPIDCSGPQAKSWPEVSSDMNPMRALLLAVAALVAAGIAGPAGAADGAQSPYAGQQSRAIKALSDEEVAALRNGEGMGLAKAAELNGYPGPRHALDLAGELGLSEVQLRQVRAVYDRMSAAAQALGAALVEREATLHRLFAPGEIPPRPPAPEDPRSAARPGRPARP